MSRLVLQPRGTSRDNGPKNYAKSVRAGVLLTDVAASAGADAASLAALYPDGVVRLWGSTPTLEKNNAKATALRERRVGDEVLFYADSGFFAHARIIGLFRNPTLARAVWGSDDEGRTWEHMMALGDVVELPSPVPAKPILRAHGLSAPLRSLTLVDTTAAAALGVAAEVPSLRRLSMTKLLAEFGVLSSQQSLMFLWVLGRLAGGGGRLVRMRDLWPAVTQLLQRYGFSEFEASPEHLFASLSGILCWEVSGPVDQATGTPGLSAVDVDGSTGFTAPAELLLSGVPARVRAVGVLLGRHQPDVNREALLSDVNLAGYDSASGYLGGSTASPSRPERRATTTSQIVRDRRVADSVKALYRNECQVCGDRLDTRVGPYSEAAHVRGLGTPHEGPDVLANVLCLCSNHHVLFDTLTIYIDTAGVVRFASDGSELHKLTVHPDHELQMANVAYHRELCGLSD